MMIGKILQSKMETLLSHTSTIKTTTSSDLMSNATMPILNETRFLFEEYQQGNGSDNTELFRGYPAPLLHFATICCILFILLGIPGNLGTIIALYRCKKVRNATAVFIMNLSVSDLMFCCFNLPLAASTFYSRAWRHGRLLCQLFPLLRYGLLAVSLFTVLAITINRYVMIGHPTLYPKLYRKEYLGLMVALTWICGFGALIATWLGVWGQFGLDQEIGSCSILPDEHGRSPKAFLFMVAFVIPCISIVVCYARIFYIVRKTALKSRSVPRSANTSIAQASKLSTAEHSTSTSIRKFLKSKTTSSCEDSAIGTSTTGASGTISTDRSSSVYFDHIHLKNGSPNHFEKEIKQNIINSVQNQKLDEKISSENGGYFVKPRESVHFLEHKLIPNTSFLHKKAFSDPKINFPDLGDHFKHKKQRNSLEYNNKKLYISPNPDRNEQNYLNISKSNPESPVRNANGLKFGDNYQASPNRVNFEKLNNKNYLEPPSLNFGKKRSSSSGIEDEMSIRSGTPTSHSGEFSKKGSKRKKRMPSVNLSSVFRRGSNSPSRRSSSMTNVAGKMTSKDKKLLKMILVIFLSFLICYLPITISKTFRHVIEIHTLDIAGYILIYLTTCMNPIIYVVMSSEYRQAYKNLLMCKSSEATQQNRSGSQK